MAISGASWCRVMEDVLEQRELDPRIVFAEAGLSGLSGSSPDLTTLSDAYTRAWSFAVAQSGDPGVALVAPAHPLVALGVLSHAVMAAPDVRSALHLLARYCRVASPTTLIEIRLVDRRLQIVLTIVPGRLPVAPQRYDHVALTCARGISWVTGRSIRPLAYHRPGAAPLRAKTWEATFDCRVVFGAPECLLEFDADVLGEPIPTADTNVAQMSTRLAAEALKQHADCVSTRVRQALHQLLCKGDPRRDAVAAALSMSERTLQRRLTEEGTSFARLVDEVRRECAERYLRQGAYSSTEMSFALGFADPSNFYRACKRWFGSSPAAMRGQFSPAIQYA